MAEEASADTSGLSSRARVPAAKTEVPVGRPRAAAIGVIAGLASGLLGVGGGFLIVPLLAAWAKSDPRRVSGTSLAAILPIAVVGAVRYYFGSATPQVSLPVAFFLVVGSTGGAFVGAHFIHHVPRRALQILVAGSLAVVGLDEVARAVFPSWLVGSPGAGPLALDAVHALLIALCGLAIGVLSGLTGVGGGIFLVPTMVIGFGMGQHLAQGTSLLAILPTAAVGAATHFRRGNVDVRAGAWIGVAGVPAALLGASLALGLPQGVLAGLFGAFLLLAASRMWPRARG